MSILDIVLPVDREVVNQAPRFIRSKNRVWSFSYGRAGAGVGNDI